MTSAIVAAAMPHLAMDGGDVEIGCELVMRYLRLPPPERARDAPTLLDPRVLLLRAALLLDRLLEAPPKALPLRLDELGLLGMLRLPTRSLAVPVPRFAPTLLAAGDAPVRFAPALPVRLAPADGCVRAVAP